MNKHPFTLTPCFSRVFGERHDTFNRFNGFPGANR
jgi:hypothetical protein